MERERDRERCRQSEKGGWGEIKMQPGVGGRGSSVDSLGPSRSPSWKAQTRLSLHAALEITPRLWREIEGGPRHPSRPGGTHGRISRGEGSRCLWELPGPHPGLGAPRSSLQTVSQPPCPLHTEPQVFFITMFPLKARLADPCPVPRESQAQGAEEGQLCFTLPSPPPHPRATWTEACLPRSPDGGIPGRSDNRLPSNLLAWNSLPGLSPPGRFPEGGSQPAREGQRGRGHLGATLEAQGHPATLIRTLMVLGDL